MVRGQEEASKLSATESFANAGWLNLVKAAADVGASPLYGLEELVQTPLRFVIVRSIWRCQ